MYFGTLSDLFYQNKEWISKLPKINQLSITKPVILRIINKYYQLKIASRKLYELRNENIQSPYKNYIKRINNLSAFNKSANQNKKRNFSEVNFKRSQSLKKVKSNNYDLLNFPKIPDKALVTLSNTESMTTNIHLYNNLTDIYNKNINKNSIKNIMINNQKSTISNTKSKQKNLDSSGSRFSYRKKLKKYKSEIKKVILSSGNFLLNEKKNEIRYTRNTNINIHDENFSIDKTNNFSTGTNNKKTLKIKFKTKVKFLKNDLIEEYNIKAPRNLKKKQKFFYNLLNIKLETKEKKDNENLYRNENEPQTIQNNDIKRSIKNKFTLNSIISQTSKKKFPQDKFGNKISKFRINNLQPLYTSNS